MDRIQLKTFIECAKFKSFSQAATSLHITQSAISKRIAALESDLACRLFDRIGREIWLTEAGRTFLPHALECLRAFDNSISAVRNLEGSISGPLSLATSHHVGSKRLPAPLKYFIKRYPAVALNLGFMESEMACQAVLLGEVELALITLPLQKMDDLHYISIWEDPMKLVIAMDHPALAAMRGQSDAASKALFQQLISEVPAILPDSSTYTRQLIDSRLSEYKIDVAMTTNFLDTIKMLVEIGMGWSVLPESMLDQALYAVPEKNMEVTRHLGVVWHKKRTLGIAAAEFIEYLRSQTATKQD